MGSLSARVVQLRHILPRQIGNARLAEARQDDTFEQPSVLAGSSWLALGLCVLGEEALREIGDGRRRPRGVLGGGRVLAVGDKPQEAPCLATGLVGRPGGTVSADSELAQPCLPAATGPVFEDVGFGVAALHPNAEPGNCRIPQDALGAVRCRLQGVDRPFRDFALHCWALAVCGTQSLLGTT